MPGYSGLNCTDKCPYPTYGNRCQENCDCSNDTCDLSTGCISLTTGIFLVKKLLLNRFLHLIRNQSFLIWQSLSF